MKILGFVPRSTDLNLPDRHLGLIFRQLSTLTLKNSLILLQIWLKKILILMSFLSLARPLKLSGGVSSSPIAPLGQRIAIADDQAFFIPLHNNS